MWLLQKSKRYLAFAIVLLLAAVLLAWGEPKRAFSLEPSFQAERLQVFVSILPQKCFVQRIGGNRVQVSVLVGPGQSPAVYEPLPKQMAALAETALYFPIGVPFETVWQDRIQELNPRLHVVDTQAGIPLRRIDGARQNGEEGGEGEVKDPHIWLDPILVKKQGQTIYEALAAFDPTHKEYYQQNLIAFQTELEELHRELEGVFQALDSDKLMVFHPAWGYLTDRYGLRQIPIEIEGKEPGPRALAELIDLAKKEGIRAIFVEEQSAAEAAYSVARAVGAKVVKIDPLAADYFSNLRQIAQAIEREH